MNSKPKLILFGIFLFFLALSSYTVDETEQAVRTQFGNPVGEPVREAGLHFKLPFIQDVRRFEKRVLEWEGEENRITTKEERIMLVGTTARWRIVDPVQFLKSIRDERTARSRLDDVLDGATRSVLSANHLIDAVRSSNRSMTSSGKDDEPNPDSAEAVTVGRDKLVAMILDQARPQVESMGIEIVDFRFRRIEYDGSTRDKVYLRMTSERNRIAERFRSEGRGKQAEIEGKKDFELKQIESEAFRKAEITRGEADAEAARIYAEAYGQDPAFYAFYQSLETLRTALAGGETTLVLSTSGDLLKHIDRP